MGRGGVPNSTAEYRIVEHRAHTGKVLSKFREDAAALGAETDGELFERELPRTNERLSGALKAVESAAAPSSLSPNALCRAVARKSGLNVQVAGWWLRRRRGEGEGEGGCSSSSGGSSSSSSSSNSSSSSSSST